MKTFCVAVAVAFVLAFISIQESSAVPFTEEYELEEPVMFENPAGAAEEASVDLWKRLHNRQKRGIKCKFCCGCCTPGICGVCCKF
ncbi:hepcidin-like [Pholidichthys leucotaenia]